MKAKAPKTMTMHDYKEVWNFLYKEGVSVDKIPNTGIKAYMKAKSMGFIESKNWGYIPIGDWKPRQLKFIETEDGMIPVWDNSSEWINRKKDVVGNDKLISSKVWRGLMGFLFVGCLGFALYMIFKGWVNS